MAQKKIVSSTKKKVEGKQELFFEEVVEPIRYKFGKNTKYFEGIVHEWNLPAGHCCPGAVACLVKVDRETGKFANDSDGSFRCYAAAAERFPSARKSRWRNFDFIRNGGVPKLPKNCKAVRIHSSGDFMNQAYFDLWLGICRENPLVEFWAYTKSINYWVARIDEIPYNLTLTASRGSKFDLLIDKYGLKCATVVKPDAIQFTSKSTAIYNGKQYPIDYGDNVARMKDTSFLLLDNHTKVKPDKDDEKTDSASSVKIVPSNNTLFDFDKESSEKLRRAL